jgi:mono/diheme cytochrome c family protein
VVLPSRADLLRASCARRTQAALPTRVSSTGEGSAVALVRAGDKLLAYVADADSRSLHTVSVDDGKELARTRLEGSPEQLVVLADGRVAVTVTDAAHVAVLEPGAHPSSPLAVVCERETPPEPWGIALSPNDAKLVVSSAWAGALAVLDGRTFALERVVKLARDPRSVLVDDHGVAYVTHLVGAKLTRLELTKNDSLPSTIDLSAHKASPAARLEDLQARRTASQGYALAKMDISPGDKDGASRLLVPMVSVDPGQAERPTSVYYGPPFDGIPKEAPIVGVLDTRGALGPGVVVLATSDKRYIGECLLPRAAAVRQKTSSLFVACYGIDALLELDARALDPFRVERRRFTLPPGPGGVAVDDATGRAVVFSQMGAAVSVLSLDSAHDPVTIPLDYHPDPELAAAARGRLLFYRTDDVRISVDGVGCSSCHPDGREDGNTWTTPMGPRQTPMLAGRMAGTAPYGWEGDRATLADYIGNTVTRLGGKGLEPRAQEDLASYLLAMKGPSHRTAQEEQLVQRGHQIFTAAEQGCSNCHVGGIGTDATTHHLAQHKTDTIANIDTPSLRFVSGTAPYFHDGRYETLEALLADPTSIMGNTASLGDADRRALAAYLRSL